MPKEAGNTNCWKKDFHPATYHPRIEFSTTRNCNLRCLMCPWGGGEKARTAQQAKEMVMPMDIFAKALPDAIRLGKEISFTSYGEFIADPLWRERMQMLAGYAQEFPDLTFSQITNGTLLTPENLQYMKGLKHVKFFISLDTLNPLVYSSIRIGAMLSDALANIRSLRENLRAIGVEQVDIIFLTLLMKRTILGIPAVIDFAKEIDATVILKHVYKQGIVTHHESLYHYPIFSNNFLTQCKQYAESKGVNFSPPPPFAEGPETEKDRKRDEQNAKAHGCTYLNHPGVILIEHQGDFYMCSGLVRLGNLREKTFEELFYDKKYQVYRD